MNLFSVALAQNEEIPPIEGFYQYLVGMGGLYVRAVNEFFEAVVLIGAAEMDLPGLDELAEGIVLAVPKIPIGHLLALRSSAQRHLPNEAMYQLRVQAGEWKIAMPKQTGTPTSLTFDDLPDTVLDIHSHGTMDAFFSQTDNGDEQGLRLYCVIGNVDTEEPEILCRVGVFGHHLNIPASEIFEELGVFTDKYIAPSQDVRYVPLDEQPLDDGMNIEDEPGITVTDSGLYVAHI